MQSCFVLISLYRIASSANSRIWEWVPVGRSLIYNRKRIGPKTEPWGTPDVTWIWSEVVPSSMTHCDPVCDCFIDAVELEFVDQVPMGNFSKGFAKVEDYDICLFAFV